MVLELISGCAQVKVETLGHGSFLVNVFSGKSCPGLLVSILEAIDELGLTVLEATATCADTFRLEAIGGEVTYIQATTNKQDKTNCLIDKANRCN